MPTQTYIPARKGSTMLFGPIAVGDKQPYAYYGGDVVSHITLDKVEDRGGLRHGKYPDLRGVFTVHKRKNTKKDRNRDDRPHTFRAKLRLA